MAILRQNVEKSRNCRMAFGKVQLVPFGSALLSPAFEKA